MTTGWLIVNIALIAVVTAIVAVPAVLIPTLLDRGSRAGDAKPAAQQVRRPAPAQRWVNESQRRADAA